MQEVKLKFMDGLLKLSQEKSLEYITIKDLLDECHISKQSFYNYFLDKNDLIHAVYLYKIIPEFLTIDEHFSFYKSMVSILRRMRQYHYFLKQALVMEGQNNLRDFIFDHCQNFDIAYHQKIFGKDKMNASLVFATKYHAMASSCMVISWILSNMPTSEEELAALITELRNHGMNKLFNENPYL